MRMLWCSMGKTRRGWMRNDFIIEMTGAIDVSRNIQGMRLQCFGHIIILLTNHL